MVEQLSIIIADDDTVFPYGLKVTLLQLNKKHKIRIAVNGKQVIDMLTDEKADIIFMDYNMPVMDGAKAARIIKKKFPESKIIACTYYQEREIVHELVRAGINGYILKEAKRYVIESAVKVIMQGGEYYSDEIKCVIQNLIDDAVHHSKAEAEKNKFTKRELEIIHLVCEKYSNAEIAEKFCIEVRTVETHLYNIYKISDTHNHSDLKKYADEHCLFHKV